MLLLLQERISWTRCCYELYYMWPFVLSPWLGTAFVRNDAKVFRFCTSKYVFVVFYEVQRSLTISKDATRTSSDSPSYVRYAQSNSPLPE
jgi:hypothetical protein